LVSGIIFCSLCLFFCSIETGCGKSTQLPLYLHEGGWTSDGTSAIVCTQPRRLAAITLANRVAEEYGCSVGEQVGYGIRFDYKCSSLTKIKYYTDGVLLREIMSDPLLSRYSCVIIDEAHQRSLNSDILLGLLKKICRKRQNDSNFRLIITSATLDCQLMKNFFELNMDFSDDRSKDTATILSIQGRQYPVDILYSNEPCSNYVMKCLETIYSIHEKEDNDGDILVFLPGSEEIELLISLFKEAVDNYHANQYHNNQSKQKGSHQPLRTIETLYFLPLYSTLPSYQQMKVFESTPYGMRKVVLSTNIAESSITIENMKYVIDSCFVKYNFFDVTSGIESLITCEIAKSNAMQRAGRAGKFIFYLLFSDLFLTLFSFLFLPFTSLSLLTSDLSLSILLTGRSQAGKCYRLLTELDYERKLNDFPLVEIQRSDISFIILQLKSLGIKDLLHFDFISPPSSSLVIYALELLYSLQAINEKGEITILGLQMAEMPIEPKLSKCLLSSLEQNCSEEMLSIIAMLSVEYPFIQLKGGLINRNSSTLTENQLERIKNIEKDIRQYVVQGSDHLTLLNIFNGFQEVNYNISYCDSNSLLSRNLLKAKEIRSNLLSLLKKIISSSSSSSTMALLGKKKLSISSCGNDSKIIRKCLITGFFSYVAKLSNRGKYQLLRSGKEVEPYPLSVIMKYGQFPEYVVFNDVIYNNTSNSSSASSVNENQITFIREVTKIDPLWLYDVASHYYDLKL
jgi:ATP-dependent RNA helicase DDX35